MINGSKPLTAFWLISLATACSSAQPDEEVEAEATSASQEAIINGSVDGTGAFNNAVVWMQSVVGQTGTLCTGTLIAPDVVLTAGHCVLGWFPARVSNDASHTPVASGGLEVDQRCVACSTVSSTCTPCNPGNSACSVGTNCIIYDSSQIDGRWHPTFADRASPTVSFGPHLPDDAEQGLVRYATGFNSPQWVGSTPFSGGHADIILVGLSGGLLDPYNDWAHSSVAIPREIYTSPPAGLTTASPLGMIGFSLATHAERQRARGQGYAATGAEQFTFTLNSATTGALQIEPGDSGSPVLFGGINGSVMGVLQGYNAPSVGRATSTFYPGATGTHPNLSQWLEKNGRRSYCSATELSQAAGGGSSYVKLMNWRNADESDSALTTERAWNGCYPGFDRLQNGSQSYGYKSLDGWIPRPDLPQPAGTVALNSYVSASGRDLATLTAGLAPSGYARRTQLGWIYTSGGSGRVPLYVWYSATRGDFRTTTSPSSFAAEGYTRVGPATGIGYVYSSSMFTQRVP